MPGFEIKAWFPLATEITARFKDSQNHFTDDRTYVAMIAWLPEHLIYGKPYILDVIVVSGASVAKSRDDHYHNPPDYLVLEPGDTTARTRNLQQTNTNGYKFQGTKEQFKQAEKVVAGWGAGRRELQSHLKLSSHVAPTRRSIPLSSRHQLCENGPDRSSELEAFKTRVQGTKVNGMTVRQWYNVLASENDELIKKALEQHLHIKEADAEQLLK